MLNGIQSKEVVTLINSILDQIYAITSSHPYLKHVWKSKIKEAIDSADILIRRNSETNEVVAFIIYKIYRTGNIVNLKWLATKSSYRQHGHMHSLFRLIEEKFPDKVLRCETRFTNIPMRTFLVDHHGFTKTKVKMVGKHKDIQIWVYEKDLRQEQLV